MFKLKHVMPSLMVIIALAISTTLAMEIKDNCFECARTNNGKNYMCNGAGRLPGKSEYAVACCNPDDEDEFCLKSETNICSPTFNEAQHSFYTYCPLINQTGCGVPFNKDSKELKVVEATNQPQTFSFESLRYHTAEWKFYQADVCHYQVQNPTYYYSSGKVFITFTQAESGVKLYLNAGSNVTNSTEALVENNRTVELNKKYEIDQSLNYIVTAIPELNSYNTSFTFEYSTDGTEYDWLELYYYQWFLKHPNGMVMLYIAGALAICIVCLFLCCIVACCRSCCCKKKNQVDPFQNVELTASGYKRHKQGLDDVMDNEDPTAKQLQEVGSVDSELMGQTDIEGPVMQKESKAKHDKDLQDAYLNPFKPENIQKNKENQEKSYQSSHGNNNINKNGKDDDA